jgi:hypothetical protein
MKWKPVIAVALLAVGAAWLGLRPRERAPGGAIPPASALAVAAADAPAARPASAARADAPATPRAAPRLTTAEKAARVAAIRADYDALRRAVADELAAVGAAGVAGPGPFTETRVFLRRLVLLQREERADLARVLDAAELEELEWRESPAGQLVAQRLGGTAATEAQRRAAFRIERDFDERFGFAFDLAREELAERARVRREADEKIRAVLGEELFRAWAGAGR